MLDDGPLSEAERQLFEAAGTGALVDLRTGDPDLDDPAQVDNWTSARAVRAELLVSLITGARILDGERLKAVRLRGARIDGPLDLEAATLLCPLLLQDCYFGQPINLKEATALSISLPGCQVPGVDASQLVVRSNLALNQGFIARGEVRLVGAHVGGALNFRKARLMNPNGHALQAARLAVDGTMFCDDSFTAHGEVGMLGAHIGSVLTFGPSNLINPNGRALFAPRLIVDGEMLCWGGLITEGAVYLVSARIGGDLVLDAARLVNPGGYALAASGMTVEGEISCRHGFNARGEINLFGARIARRLDLSGATLENPDGLVLDLEGLSTAALYLLPDGRPEGEIDLTNAQVGHFYDDADTWPIKMRIRGLVYDSLENDSVSVRSRLRWLTLHEGGYVPGIYDQLAAVYRRAGRVEDARLVSIAKQKRRRRELNIVGKIWNWLLYLTVGYGYRTWWAGLWLLGLLVVGSVVFDSMYPSQMRPAAAVVPAFQPVAYTFDVLVPILDLGQRKVWLPVGAAQIWSWGLIGAGWILTTAVVAGLTNALKRD